MADVMEVSSWSGEWGLPSIDIACLEVLAYAKFSGCPVKVSPHNKPWKSPTWSLPVFRSHNEVFTSSRKVMDFLRKQNFNADYQLTAKQGADTLAFMALIEDKLNPALQYTFWVDTRNYGGFTRALYAKRLPIPISFFLPGQMAKKAKYSVTNGCVIEEDKETAFENKIFKDALDCLSFLSIQLGDQTFFFGESPTTLDAVAFAHLAIVWRSPILPNNKLKNLLISFDNLVRFCSRVLQRYFPVNLEDASNQSKPSSTDSSQDDDPFNSHHMWLSAGVAGIAMATYALLNGVIKINIQNDEKEEEDEDPTLSSFSFEDQE